MSDCFLMRDRKGIDLDGEGSTKELGEVEGVENQDILHEKIYFQFYEKI